MNYRSLILAAAVSCAGVANAAMFSEDFEGGSLSQWTGSGGGGYYGYIRVDPLDSSNHCLSFTGLNAGGDIFSNPAVAISGSQTYRIKFRYLGIPDGPGDTDTGGYFGVNPSAFAGPEKWVYATGSASGATDVLIDDGAWHWYQYDFTEADLPFSGTISIKFEDFVGSDGVSDNAMFDDVSLDVVPEPASMAALGLGLLAVLRKRRSR